MTDNDTQIPPLLQRPPEQGAEQGDGWVDSTPTPSSNLDSGQWVESTPTPTASLEPMDFIKTDPSLAVQIYRAQNPDHTFMGWMGRGLVNASKVAALPFTLPVDIAKQIPSMARGTQSLGENLSYLPDIVQKNIYGNQTAPQEQMDRAAQELQGTEAALLANINDQGHALANSTSHIWRLFTHGLSSLADKDLSDQQILDKLNQQNEIRDVHQLIANGQTDEAMRKAFLNSFGYDPGYQGVQPVAPGYSSKAVEEAASVAELPLYGAVGDLVPAALTRGIAGAGLGAAGAGAKALGWTADTLLDSPPVRELGKHPWWAGWAGHSMGIPYPAAAAGSFVLGKGLPAIGRGVNFISGGLGDLITDSAKFALMTPEEQAEASFLMKQGDVTLGQQAFVKGAAGVAQGIAGISPLFLTAHSPEEIRQLAALGAIFGAGGATSEAIGNAALGARQMMFDSHLMFDKGNYINLSPASYDYGHPDDDLHAQATANMSPGDVANINRQRHFFQGNARVFVLPTDEFQSRFGDRMYGAAGNDIYYNGDTGFQYAKAHEPLHIITDSLDPATRNQLYQRMTDLTDPSVFASRYYSSLLGRPVQIDFNNLPDAVSDSPIKLPDGTEINLTKKMVYDEMVADSMKHLDFGKISGNDPNLMSKLQQGAARMMEYLGMPTTTSEVKGILGVQPTIGAFTILDNAIRNIARDQALKGAGYGSPPGEAGTGTPGTPPEPGTPPTPQSPDPAVHFPMTVAALRSLGFGASEAQLKADQAVNAARSLGRPVTQEDVISRALSGKFPTLAEQYADLNKKSTVAERTAQILSSAEAKPQAPAPDITPEQHRGAEFLVQQGVPEEEAVSRVLSNRFMPEVNIGMNTPEGGTITPEDALDSIKGVGGKVLSHSIHQSDIEPTFVGTLGDHLTPEQLKTVSDELGQEAIAYHLGAGIGDLYGSGAENWKPFNPDYFIQPNGKTISENLPRFMPATNPEAINTENPAAIKTPDGKIWSGKNHGLAFSNMTENYPAEQLGKWANQFGDNNYFETGYMTNNNQYVSPQEAQDRALRYKQMTPMDIERMQAQQRRAGLPERPMESMSLRRAAEQPKPSFADQYQAMPNPDDYRSFIARTPLYENDLLGRPVYVSTNKEVTNNISPFKQKPNYLNVVDTKQKNLTFLDPDVRTDVDTSNIVQVRDAIDKAKKEGRDGLVILAKRSFEPPGADWDYEGVSPELSEVINDPQKSLQYAKANPDQIDWENPRNLYVPLEGKQSVPTPQPEELKETKPTPLRNIFGEDLDIPGEEWKYQPAAIEGAKELAQSNQIRTNSEDEFFGKIWPNLLRKTGQTFSTSDKNIPLAAASAVSEVDDWLKNNPDFKDYYSKDYQTTRNILNQNLDRPPTDPEFRTFQLLNGLLSNQTPLGTNTNESINALKLLMSQGNLDGITTKINPETGNRKMGESPFSISGTSAPSKAFALSVLNNLIKQHGLDGAINYLQEEVPVDQLNQFNQEMGYKSKTVGNLPAIKGVVEHATGQSENIPRVFIFGKKVGAYSLNSLGDSRYNTVDTWESRFIRSYFKGLWDNNTGIAGADEHELFDKFVKNFNSIYREQIDPDAESSALQAGRWYYILDAAKRSGYQRSLTNMTISQYANKYFNPISQ